MQIFIPIKHIVNSVEPSKRREPILDNDVPRYGNRDQFQHDDLGTAVEPHWKDHPTNPLGDEDPISSRRAIQSAGIVLIPGGQRSDKW